MFLVRSDRPPIGPLATDLPVSASTWFRLTERLRFKGKSIMDKNKLKRTLAATLRPTDLIGSWGNELGSTMSIKAAQGETFTGDYASTVSGKGGPTTGTLQGTLAGGAIAFSVNWQPEYASVTSWTGLVLEGEEGVLSIYALWQLAEEDPTKGWWQAINAGMDSSCGKPVSKSTPARHPDRRPLNSRSPMMRAAVGAA